MFHIVIWIEHGQCWEAKDTKQRRRAKAVLGPAYVPSRCSGTEARLQGDAAKLMEHLPSQGPYCWLKFAASIFESWVWQ